MGIVHIVGAGVAGLACAVRLTGADRKVVLYEAAGHAGGRCRSFYDDALGCRIDNGNHLLLSGNRAVMAYLDETGAADSLSGPERAAFPFVELASGRRWTVRPNPGLIPWWIFAPGRRVPDSWAGDYLSALKLARAAPQQTIAGCFDTRRPLYRRFWEPLAVAVLNTQAEEAAASLLWPVVMEIFGHGEAASRPRIAAVGLSQSFVEPALETLSSRGATLHFSQRLRAFENDGDRVAALDFGRHRVPLDPQDLVVLAVPPTHAVELVPGLSAPIGSRAIVNVHFRLSQPPHGPDGLPFLGIIGGTAQWLFLRGEIVSVTVSAAESLVERPAEEIATLTWADVARALELDPEPLPPCRVVKERRATFAQTPDELARRPGTRTHIANLLLAGDWTDTGLPATIEGAIRSGFAAAEVAAGGIAGG
jgi:squalene-associated FAD-dependent desaturase